MDRSGMFTDADLDDWKNRPSNKELNRLLKARKDWERMDSAIATLRHAYAQLASGRVVDQKAFAEGLIGRAIRELEQINNEQHYPK